MPTNKELEQQLGELNAKLDAALASQNQSSGTERELPHGNVTAELAKGEDQEAKLSDNFLLAFGRASDPVPSHFRGIVDQVLNKSFDIHLDGVGGGFKFSLIVPNRYSSLNAEQRRQSFGFDVRSRVIDTAEGENGVKSWCETVLNSFNPEMRALIVNDQIVNP